MDAALYGESGYYSSGKVEFGILGDFYTTSHVHELFATLIAEQFARIWEEDGSPADYTIVELGPGDGTFAENVLTNLRANLTHAFNSIKYVCVDISPSLRRRQQDRLREFKVEWLDHVPARDCGIIFSNEFFDALPVHVVQQINGRLNELYVEDDAKWVIGDVSTPEISSAWRRAGTVLKEGQRAEICLDAIRVLNELSTKFKRAHMISIDYGDLAERLFSEDRFEGTLRCFKSHEMTNDPFLWRDCDITASVNFTLLLEFGKDFGFEVRRFVDLPEYLMSLGLLDRVAELTIETKNPRELQKRLALKQLFLPQGIAGSFKVLQTCKSSPRSGDIIKPGGVTP